MEKEKAEEFDWRESLSFIVSNLLNSYFGSHSSVRCKDPESTSGHDYIRGSMALFTKNGDVIIHSICRYCGDQKQQVIANVMMNPSFSNSNNFSEREM